MLIRPPGRAWPDQPGADVHLAVSHVMEIDLGSAKPCLISLVPDAGIVVLMMDKRSYSKPIDAWC